MRIPCYSAHEKLRDQLLALDGGTVTGEFVLELCDSDATLPNDEQVLSTRLWLLGARQAAEEALELILGILAQQNVADYVRLAACEDASNKRPRASRSGRMAAIAIVAALIAWWLIAHR